MRFPWSLTGCFLALGLAFRFCHYLRDLPVWHDEAALVLNVIGKNFTQLLGPLYFAEASPPLFLWLERSVLLLLGDSAAALRLVPFLASCASLVLLAWTARRILSPAAAAWAILLFAASDRLLEHCCEAKPYAVDVLVSTVVIALFVRGSPTSLMRRLLLIAAIAPFLIWVSYPACFALGGLLVVLLAPIAQQGRLGLWAAYGLLVAVIFAAFALLVIGPVHAQRAVAMDSCWVHQFPPWGQPWHVPTWALFSTFDVFRYCFEPAGHGLALLAVVGAILWWRQGQRTLVVLALLPLGLALAAAFLGAYPYGGARVEVYAAPGLTLLVAAGIAPVWTWLDARMRFGGWVLAAVLLATPALATYHVLIPWRRADSSGAAAYVLGHRQTNEAVAGNLWQDGYYFRCLGPDFQPMSELKLPTDRRQWFVITVWTAAQREQLIAETAGRRPILDRREFMDTTVILLEKESQVSSAFGRLSACD